MSLFVKDHEGMDIRLVSDVSRDFLGITFYQGTSGWSPKEHNHEL